jgi:AbrB family looped-hinge helix DNA binding protein
MRVTSKGQVTIPKDVRDALGIAPGTDVGFQEEDGKIILINKDGQTEESRGERLVRLLVEFGDRMRREGKLSGLTTDEIMEMTRGYSEDVNDPGFKRST